MTAISISQRTDLNGSPAKRRRPASISAVAWRASDGMEYRKWVLEGRRIGAMGRGSPWWVGDWLLYGTARWGERYVEAVKITGYDAKSLRNMRYVASRFELSLRRDNLTWSHHALLAALETDEQKHWLDRAAADKFSVDDLRIELRSARLGRYSDSALEEGSPHAPGEIVVVCPKCGHEIRPAPPPEST
jgi:hypothetical protein